MAPQSIRAATDTVCPSMRDWSWIGSLRRVLDFSIPVVQIKSGVIWELVDRLKEFDSILSSVLFLTKEGTPITLGRFLFPALLLL